MDFATGALGSLLPKLAQLLQDEYRLQKGVKKEIESLCRELETMRAALRNVGEVPLEQLSELVKIWGRDVRELSYDMEDIVDTFLVRVQGPEPPSKKSTKRFFKKMIQKITKASTRRGISQEINDIKERVKEVAERRDRYKVDAISSGKTTSVDPRVTAMYTKVTDLVGIDEPREELITRLMKEEDGVSSAEQRIVSVVGFGGLGKTTLAKAVFDKIKAQFDCSAFISVSQNLEMTKILKDMLYELDKPKYNNIHSTTGSERQLIDLLQEFLQTKRYLIVVDDIWDTKAWDIIQCALLENRLRSRIITTTRIVDVAEHAGSCYKMKPLTQEMSKILFYGRVFGSESKCPHQILDISKKILNKCGGVPLAIVTTSSLLANKSRNTKEWHHVCDSIGSGLGNNPGIDHMRKILLLSYYDLKPHLKTCLLYLSVFPEDYMIERDRLIWRWIAEGFVKQGEGCQSLFENGISYFNELVNRSLIQPAYQGYDDDPSYIGYCRVHDMVLDLICSLSKEESFATTIVSADSKQVISSLGNKVRRLSLYCTSWPTVDASKMRSLTISNYSIISSMPPLSCYNLLRVLDLEGCDLTDHTRMEFIGRLFHLRYLSLRGSGYAGEIPAEIGKLQFLQTMNLLYTCIEELPLCTFGLTQLMCLFVDPKTRLLNGIGNLSCLEALSVGVDSVYVAEELGHLTELRMLDVRLRPDESICKALVGSIGKLHKIQTLQLHTGWKYTELEGSLVSSLCSLCYLRIGYTSWLPRWIDPASLLLLSHLDIGVDRVRREDIHVLGMLQALNWLRVRVYGLTMQVFESRFTVSADAFPRVTHCRFGGFPTLPSMFTPGAMPRLQHFEFEIGLEDFYDGGLFIADNLAFGHLPSLRTVLVRLPGLERVISVEEEDVVATKVEEARGHPNHPDAYISYGYISFSEYPSSWHRCIDDKVATSDSHELILRLDHKWTRLCNRYDHQTGLYDVMRWESLCLSGDAKDDKVELFIEQLRATCDHTTSECKKALEQEGDIPPPHDELNRFVICSPYVHFHYWYHQVESLSNITLFPMRTLYHVAHRLLFVLFPYMSSFPTPCCI
ncbi:hypothetical protein BS78_05G281600 [Paspalum vaginatum]|nr:hypothetical protein BS78_05G281600 [Paspalum vaginatum]